MVRSPTAPITEQQPTGPAGSRRFLGIDFGGTKMAVAVADSTGRLLASERVSTDAERGARQALDRALDLAVRLTSTAGGGLTAVGIASPGVVHDDGIDLAPNVPGWEDLRLADAVRDRLGVNVVSVANDLNAAALAELRLGALRHASPGLVVGLGTGVAAAVTVGSAVLSGHHNTAGEIGYAITGVGWPEVPAQVALETVFSGRALDQLAERLDIGGGAEALARAAATSGRVREALLDRVDELARHLVTCCLLIDPQRVVLVGGAARNDLIRSLLAKRLSQALPRQPEIVLSDFADDASLLGAVTMAQEAVLV